MRILDDYNSNLNYVLFCFDKSENRIINNKLFGFKSFDLPKITKKNSIEENWEKLAETGDFRVIEERWRATAVDIAKNIPGVLTPTQSEAFLDYWKTARTMQAAEYKMGMQMMGIDK